MYLSKHDDNIFYKGKYFVIVVTVNEGLICFSLTFMHYYLYYNNSHVQLKIGLYCASIFVQNNKEESPCFRNHSLTGEQIRQILELTK